MERFGKFELLERVGVGGMAEIFLARPSDAALSKLVAVKRILPKLNEDPAFHQMFQSEGQIALRFRHPAIIAVHELGHVSGQQYMAMEFFPGIPLSKLMDSLRVTKTFLSNAEKILIIRNIAQALQYIHDFTDHGDLTEIIHRDISPQNIMIGFDGAVKLIDFGIAKLTNTEHTFSRSIKGKVAYMSPEQARGEPLTKKTDIFSLGIVMWELLSGKKLFTGKTIDEVRQKVLQCHIPSVLVYAPDAPPELCRIYERALAPELQLRYHSAGELARDLEVAFRLADIQGDPNNLSKTVHRLFPNEIRHLKKMLRKYEVAAAIPLRSSAPVPALKPPPAPLRPINSQPRPDFEPTHSTGETFTKLLAVSILAISLAFAFVLLPLKFKSDAKRIPPLPTVTLSVPVESLKPAPPQEVVATFRPPSPPPPEVPASALRAPDLDTAPPTPVSVPTPVPVPTRETAHLAPKQLQLQVVDQKPKEMPTEKRIKPIARVKPKPLKRKIASKPAVSSKDAFVTILSEPDAKILVNGKMVGVEVVNELKVPANKLTTIKVISKDASSSQTKEFTFKPFSRNVIELSGSAE